MCHKIYQNVIAVTNRKLCKRPFMEQLDRICQCHPKAIILREKDLQEKEYAILAKDVIKLCKSYHVYCILHTYINVAKALNCYAIHMPFALLQKHSNELQNFNVIGTSVHSSQEAVEAEKIGVNYIVAGHIYATDCKKDIPPRGLIFLNEVCKNTVLPVYGIGGIKLQNNQINEVMHHGAKGVCIMSEMMKI